MHLIMLNTSAKLLILGGLLGCLPVAVRAQEACPATRPAGWSLPHARAIVARNRELLIVAFGSSSTAGWMASDVGHAYPAVLQQALGAALPQAHVAVISRGVGGQGAAQELARLERDVVPIRPQLVVWQVGANDAMRNVDLPLFRQTLVQGVVRLQGAGMDVVLMDNQRAPRLLAAPEDDGVNQALAQVAEQTGAALFARSELMDRWRAAGFPYALFVAADQLHHNDRGYACVATALARSIVEALAPRPARAAAVLLSRGSELPHPRGVPSTRS